MITGADVDAAIAGMERKEAHKLAGEFSARASGPDADPRWVLLARVFSIYFRRTEKKNPFGDHPAELSPEEIEQLRAILAGSSDPEIQSRLGDILWIAAKDHSAARIAVTAYLSSGMRLEDPESWVDAGDRYERAARLALALGKKVALISTVGDYLLERVRHHKGTDPRFLTEQLLKLLDLLRFGASAELAEYALIAAEGARGAGDGNRARAYFKRAAHLHRQSGDRTAETVAQTAAAATWAEDAERREREQNFLAAYVNLEAAIKAYRAIGRKDLIPDLQRRLKEAGTNARQNMKRLSFKLDFTKEAEAAREMVSGLSTDDAICALASFLRLAEPDEVRESVLSEAGQFPIHHLVTKIQFGQDGRKIAGSASVLSSDLDEREKAIREEMANNSARNYSFMALAFVMPAHAVILGEHSVREAEIAEFVATATIIPPGREEYFRRGLGSGFSGDFITSLHLLVPQVEHLLRYVLKQGNVITTGLDAEGIEEEWPLAKLLSLPELATILPQRLIFALRVLLTDKTGANIRNLLLHGLLPPSACASPPCIFLWWVMLHLVVFTTPQFRAFAEKRAGEMGKEGAVSGK